MLKRITAAVLAAAMTLSLVSCTNVSERSFTEATQSAAPVSAQTTVTTAKTVTTKAVTTTTKVTTTTTAEETTIGLSSEQVAATEPIEEHYYSYTFTEAEEAYLDTCLFVGDSICGGLSYYGVLPASNVASKGSVAARNIFDFKFGVGDEKTDVLTAIVNKIQPNIIFSMGMNDVNMTTKEQYVENYFNLLNKVAAYCPDSTLIVLSITPVIAGSKFTTNTRIDEFNAAMKEAIEKDGKPNWKYVDVTPELKNSANGLKSYYEAGDGIHLAQAAYYAYLWQIVKARKTISSDAE